MIVAFRIGIGIDGQGQLNPRYRWSGTVEPSVSMVEVTRTIGIDSQVKVSASVSIASTGIGIDTDTDVSLSNTDRWVCFIRIFLGKNTNTEN